MSKTTSRKIPTKDDNGGHWLESYAAFNNCPSVKALQPRYARHAILAAAACSKVVEDLTVFNQSYDREHMRAAFTTIEGRVKKPDSFFKKLYRACVETDRVVTQDVLVEYYESISDMCGVRFSCPYMDEVKQIIKKLVRPWLKGRNYRTDLQSAGHPDKDLLDSGDDVGYRSYHFFIEVPTPIDIYGKIETCICEVQARSELQHVWASRSREEFYKPEGELLFSDEHVLEDMKGISDLLHSADGFLVSVRNRIEKGKGGAS